MKKLLKLEIMAGNKCIIVADASVILKWFFRNENNVESALLLRNDFYQGLVDIWVPEHFFTELFNIMSRQYPQKAQLFFSTIRMSTIASQRVTLELASIGFELMQKYPSISFYDAAYHALAIQKGGLFLTADERYFKLTHKEGHIQLLEDYGHA